MTGNAINIFNAGFIGASEAGTLAVLFLLGGLVGVLNVVAAGGSFLTLPLLIVFGLSPSVANGTNRIAILLQNVVAVWGFHKNEYINWSSVGWLVGPALMGAPLGTWLALELPEATFQRVLAFMMVGITLFSLRQPSYFGVDLQMPPTILKRLMCAAGFFIVGFYGGFVQAGVGFLLLAMTSYVGLDLVRGNAVKVLTVLLFTVLSLGLFVWQDRVHWEFGFALGIGSAIGAFLGVRLSLAKGHAWIRKVVIMAVFGFAVHLWMTA